MQENNRQTMDLVQAVPAFVSLFQPSKFRSNLVSDGTRSNCPSVFVLKTTTAGAGNPGKCELKEERKRKSPSSHNAMSPNQVLPIMRTTQLPSASVSKRVQVRNLSYENQVYS